MLLEKGDFACKKFFEIVRKSKQLKKFYEQIMRREMKWRQSALDQIIEKEGECLILLTTSTLFESK